jgi:hypothetical protein
MDASKNKGFQGAHESFACPCDELARRQVAVIVANPPSTLPAKTASATIPIVLRPRPASEEEAGGGPNRASNVFGGSRPFSG